MKRIWLPLLLLPLLATAAVFSAQTGAESPQGFSGLNIGAGLAMGLAAIGAGIAVGMAASAGIGVLAEKRELFGTVLVLVALGEGIAIYGLLIAIIMLFGKF